MLGVKTWSKMKFSCESEFTWLCQMTRVLFSYCISNESSNYIQEKDVRKWKEELLDQRRRMMEEKLLHAEFKREVQLQAIVKKAQEEEAKVSYFVLKGK